MKIIKTLAIVSLFSLSMSTSVFASWWNPLTWFQKKAISTQQVQVETAPVNKPIVIASSTNSSSSTLLKVPEAISSVTSSESVSNKKIVVGKTLKCENYRSGSDRADDCYAQKAFDAGNPSICKKIPDNSILFGSMRTDSCYEIVGIKLEKPSICENIKSRSEFSGSYTNCLAATKRDSSICNSITKNDDAKKNCLIAVAVKEKNVKPCTLLSGDVQDWCYSGVATALQDKSICNLIIGTSLKSKCLSWVATTKNDVNLCIEANQMIGSDNSISEQCFNSVSVKDIQLCSRLSSQKKDSCISSVASSTKNLSLCEKISFPFRNDCYVALSSALKDVSVCKKINDSNFDLNDCYAKVGKWATSSAQCENVPLDALGRSDNRDGCYVGYAVRHQDKAVCNFVTIDLYKRNCQSILQAN